MKHTKGATKKRNFIDDMESDMNRLDASKFCRSTQTTKKQIDATSTTIVKRADSTTTAITQKKITTTTITTTTIALARPDWMMPDWMMPDNKTSEISKLAVMSGEYGKLIGNSRAHKEFAEWLLLTVSSPASRPRVCAIVGPSGVGKHEMFDRGAASVHYEEEELPISEWTVAANTSSKKGARVAAFKAELQQKARLAPKNTIFTVSGFELEHDERSRPGLRKDQLKSLVAFAHSPQQRSIVVLFCDRNFYYGLDCAVRVVRMYPLAEDELRSIGRQLGVAFSALPVLSELAGGSISTMMRSWQFSPSSAAWIHKERTKSMSGLSLSALISRFVKSPKQDAVWWQDLVRAKEARNLFFLGQNLADMICNHLTTSELTLVSHDRNNVLVLSDMFCLRSDHDLLHLHGSDWADDIQSDDTSIDTLRWQLQVAELCLFASRFKQFQFLLPSKKKDAKAEDDGDDEEQKEEEEDRPKKKKPKKFSYMEDDDFEKSFHSTVLHWRDPRSEDQLNRSYRHDDEYRFT